MRSLIIEAAEAGAEVWITAVNLGEVWYNLARRHSASDADAAVADRIDTGQPAHAGDDGEG